MSVQRSPKSGSGSGSQPDLRDLKKDESFINIRKRKQPDQENDFAKQLVDFRKEMMSFFKDFATSQKEVCDQIRKDIGQNTDQIRQDIAEIKDEIKTLKSATSGLSLECKKINCDLVSIKSDNAITQEKIKLLETNINKLKVNPPNDFPNSNPLFDAQHDIILEIQERTKREKNIILVGITEIKDKNVKIRREHDQQEVLKMLKQCYDECPSPIYIKRIGKYNPDSHRRLKVTFESATIVKRILRNKAKLIAGIKIYSDQTPKQQSFLKDLKQELQQRKENGESDLIIKYESGVPKIKKIIPKN